MGPSLASEAQIKHWGGKLRSSHYNKILYLVSLAIWNSTMMYNAYFTNKCQIGCLDIMEH